MVKILRLFVGTYTVGCACGSFLDELPYMEEHEGDA